MFSFRTEVREKVPAYSEGPRKEPFQVGGEKEGEQEGTKI